MAGLEMNVVHGGRSGGVLLAPVAFFLLATGAALAGDDRLAGLDHRITVLNHQASKMQSPTVHTGFQVSESVASEDHDEVALRYTGEMSWTWIAVAAVDGMDLSGRGFDDYSDQDRPPVKLGGWWDDLSFMASTGGMEASLLPDSPQTYFGKVAYSTSIWDVGRTGFTLGYGRYEGFRENGEHMELYGVGISQNLDALDAELYAGIWQTDFSNSDVNYNQMTTFQAGVMVRF